MKPNHFIYADLSSYNPSETLPFYAAVFGWQFKATPWSDDGAQTAYVNGKEVASIYQTPEKFQKMDMPHFWMSYIQVNSVADTVEKAKSLGGIIELQLDIAGFGKVALIRDPQGAGFTVYEGDSITPSRTENQTNTLIWNELHISDASKILPFYEGIFAWRFAADAQTPEHYRVHNDSGEHIADALVIPNDIKGKYEYWVCTFGVSDLQVSKEKILANGGSVIIDEGERLLMSDNSDSAFFYIRAVDSVAQGAQEKATNNAVTITPKSAKKAPIKWKAMLGLALIFASILTEQYWILGVFFLIFVVMDIRSGLTHLFETVSRNDNPILYWFIIGSWGVLSLFSFWTVT